jgi:group I intron endonuclease
MYCIYKITCVVTQEAYIGLTRNLVRRIGHHKLPSSECRRLRNAIQKYGWSNFTVSVVEDNLTLEQANNREGALIYEHNTLSPHGYNLQTGGDHRVLSEESRQKLTKSLTGKVRSAEIREKFAAAHRGKPLSEEHKQRIRDTRLRGVPRSEETKAKISAAQKGRSGRPSRMEALAKAWETNRGRHLSDEHKEKVRKARTGKPRSEETKAKIRATLLLKHQRTIIQLALVEHSELVFLDTEH